MSRQVVSFNYTLKNKQGEVLDQSPADQPISYLEEANMIIGGLESALNGMEEGQKDEVIVRPEDGYGFRDESLIDVVSRAQLPVEEINVGDYFQAGSDQHAPVVQVTKIDGDDVTLDANHPMAGIDLFFSVEVLSKRTATEEELAHGHSHSHGDDCCGGGGGGCGCSH